MICLVLDSLRSELNNKGIVALGYADDIHVESKFFNTVSEVMQAALEIIEQWGSRNSVNPFHHKNKLAACCYAQPLLCSFNISLQL